MIFWRFLRRWRVPQPHKVSFPDRVKHFRVDQEFRIMELVLMDRVKPEHKPAEVYQDKPDDEIRKKRTAAVNTEEETLLSG